MVIVFVVDEQVLGCNSVAFDKHALMRMFERSVTEDDVIEVLRNPDQTGLPTQPSRHRHRKRLAGRLVDVVFEHDPTQVVVLTVIA
jgi:hypothetical protein